MADDPMTISGAETMNVGPGLRIVAAKVTGPADYDATNGAALDVSAYGTDIMFLSLQGVYAKADALIYANYVNDDFDDADGGAVYFTWSPAKSGDAEAAELFANVDDQEDLSGYDWRMLLVIKGPTV